MGTFTKDPYDVLGVTSNSTEREIKTAYRSLALKYHPDRCTDPTQKDVLNQRFADIAHAYEILTDERLRKEYDSNNDNNNNSYYDNSKDIDEDMTATCSNNTSMSNQLSKNVNNKGHSNTNTKKSNNKNNNSTSAKSNKKVDSFDYRFSDPYEVWKRDFRNQFGKDYPGAQYDFVSHDTPIIQADTATHEKNKKELLDKHGVVQDDKFTSKSDYDAAQPKGKSKGAFGGLFGSNRNNNNNNNNKSKVENKASQQDDEMYSNVNENQLVVHDGQTDRKSAPADRSKSGNQVQKNNNETQVGEYTGGAQKTSGTSSEHNQTSSSTSSPSSSALVVSEGRNNRPIKMEVETKTEGNVTTTITSITRPDGTTETLVMRTGLPKKKQQQLPQLTNGNHNNNVNNDKNNKLLALQNGNDDNVNNSNNDTLNQLVLSNNTGKNFTKKQFSTTTKASAEQQQSALALTNNGKGDFAPSSQKTKKTYVNPLLKSSALVVKK